MLNFISKIIRKSEKVLYIKGVLGPDDKITQTYKINKKKLFEWNQGTRVLRIAIEPGDLEVLLAQIDEIPAEGKDITLQIPMGYITFGSVRKIEQLPGLKEGEYLYEVKYSSKDN